MKPRDRAKKLISELNEAPLILAEDQTFCEWLEDNLARVIEEAEQAAREEVLEYSGLADWD